MDSEIASWLRVGLSSINTLSYREGGSVGTAGTLAFLMSPLYRAYNDDGSILPDPARNTLDEPFFRNPLLIENTDAWDDTRRRLRTFNTLYSEIDLFKGLKYRINIGLDYAQDEVNRFRGLGSPFVAPNASSNATVRNRDDWGYTVENILQYNKSFGKHAIGVTALYSIQ
ncbi:MAG: hypothetical protein AAFP82_06470 [Bacteroidota bacterium]